MKATKAIFWWDIEALSLLIYTSILSILYAVRTSPLLEGEAVRSEAIKEASTASKSASTHQEIARLKGNQCKQLREPFLVR